MQSDDILAVVRHDLDELRAETHETLSIAQRADVRAQEAIRRVAELRTHCDEQFAEVDRRVDAVAGEVHKSEQRLGAMILAAAKADAEEHVVAAEHRKQVNEHVIRLWEAAHYQRQAMGFYALVIVIAFWLKGGCNVPPAP